MVFGFSYGEVLVLAGAAIALFGPKDIPVIARAAGRLSGKAVGYIQNARRQLDDVMQRSELNQVHKELQDTMAQLEAIRHEIRSGMSIINPGPMTKRVYDDDVAASLKTSDSEASAVVGKTSTGIRSSNSTTLMETSTRDFALPKILVTPTLVGPDYLSRPFQDTVQSITVLPISAADAGLLPPRTEPLSHGADLVLESMLERKVAHQASELFKESDPTMK